MFMGKNKIIIGIDQSYQDTGITIAINGVVKMSKDIELHSLKTNSIRRKHLYDELTHIFTVVKHHYAVKYDASVTVLIERIRLQSQGFLNIDYIKSIGALNALICDCSTMFDFPVYSVDTRAWKSNVVGTSKGLNNPYGIDPKKWPTILWCINHGYEKYIKYSVLNKQKRKGVIEKGNERYSYNDNIADSIGICLFGFKPNITKLLKEEH